MTSICEACPVRLVSLCQSVPARDLQAHFKKRCFVAVHQRQSVMVEGEPATSLFIVFSGIVKLLRSLPDGRTQIVGFRQPGEHFGLGERDTCTTSAEASADTVLCRFSRPELAELRRTSPQLKKYMQRESLRQLTATQDQVLMLGRMTARERVANFLLVHGYRSPDDTARPLRFAKLPMSRAEIADYLGLTVETVSRTLAALAHEEIIAIGQKSHSIHVINPAALASNARSALQETAGG
jgi:CRP/FNR family transcriptional regulator